MWASAHDLVRFGMFHLKEKLDGQKPILRPESINEMQKPTMRTGPKAHYGVGWVISDATGYTVVSHTGGMGGVSTSLRLIPSERIALAVLCNAGVSLPHTISDQVLSHVLPKFQTGGDGPRPPDPGFKTPAELKGKWTGVLSTYKSDLPLTAEFQEDGDVHIRVAGQLKTLLNGTSWEGGILRGSFRSSIATEDAERRPYSLQLSLWLRNGKLMGPVSAISTPGVRAGNALTSWIELSR